MKRLLMLLLLLVLASCEIKYTKLTIKNNTKSLIINDLRWGEIYFCSDLYPGESCSMDFEEDADDLFDIPRNLRFKLEGANGEASVQSKEKWTLKKLEDLSVSINDSTKLIE